MYIVIDVMKKNFEKNIVHAIMFKYSQEMEECLMKRIKTKNKSSLKKSLCKPADCRECANSCQSACKTSATVANLACEN